MIWGPAYYDREGHPISLYEYAELSSNDRYQLIGRDEVIPGEQILTIWTGVNLGDDQNLQIYETRIYGGPFNNHCYRYCNIEDARRGHFQCVADRADNHNPWWLRGVELKRLPPISVDDWTAPERG